MHNPLLILTQQMGLSAKWLAAQIGATEKDVQKALCEEPSDPLATYLRLTGELQVRMRVNAAVPQAFWFQVSAIDALHYKNAWRKEVGLATVPPDKGQMVALMRFLRKRHNFSLYQIKDHMEANLIPTLDGKVNWRASTIAIYIDTGKVHNPTKKIPCHPEFARTFRRRAIAELMCKFTPFDPVGPIRYDLDQKIVGEKLYVYAGMPVPECVFSWMKKAIIESGWFDMGEYGIIDRKEMPDGEEQV